MGSAGGIVGGAGAGGSRSGGKGAAFLRGSSLPSAKSSSAGSMVAAPPRLNSKSMKSLEMAGSGVTAGAGSSSGAVLKETRGLSQP